MDEEQPWNKFNTSHAVVLERVDMKHKVPLAHYFNLLTYLLHGAEPLLKS